MEGLPTLNGAGRRRLRTNKGRSAQGPEEGARQGAKEEALGMTVLLASHTSARRLFRQGEEGLSEWREGGPPNPLQRMSKGEHVQLSRGLPWRQQAAEGQVGISDWERKRLFNENMDRPLQSGSRTMLELCEEGRGGVERRSHHKPSNLLLSDSEAS